MHLADRWSFAELRGWTAVDEYVDVAISESKTSRLALDRLLADAEAGRFNLVVVGKLDRLGRLGRLDRALPQLLLPLKDFDSWGDRFASPGIPGSTG